MKPLIPLLILSLCACATPTPPSHNPDEPVWSVKRTLVRHTNTPSNTIPLPLVDQSARLDLAPGLFATSYPIPDHLSPLRPGELEVYAINTKERLRVTLFGPRGHLQPEAAQELSWLFRDHRREVQHPLHPRLLKLLYLIAQTYQRPLVLISGYRHPRRQKAKMSRHSSASAADIRVPGVPMEDVSLLIKTVFEDVGVGIYPKSDFVHIDARASSYYWIDHSGPGEAKREAVLDLDPMPPRGSDWTLWSEELPPVWHY